MDRKSIDAVSVHRYRVGVRFDRPFVLEPQHRCATWRGAFGAVLRGLVCHDRQADCDSCPLRSRCPYATVFAPSIPAGRPVIARLKSPPRPFVLRDPLPESIQLPAGSPLSLGLNVVGTAADQLPYLVVTLRRLGEVGIGPRAARFSVDWVRSLDAAEVPVETVYERGSDLVRASRTPLHASDLQRPGDDQARRVRVRFVTATDVRGSLDGERAGAPPFGVLVRRARDRVSALATFFGERAIEIDPGEVARIADGVSMASADVRAQAFERRSSRTGQRHPLGGVVGSAVYEGKGVAAAMPWLRMVEVIGVGKHATFGNGHVEVQVVG